MFEEDEGGPAMTSRPCAQPDPAVDDGRHSHRVNSPSEKDT